MFTSPFVSLAFTTRPRILKLKISFGQSCAKLKKIVNLSRIAEMAERYSGLFEKAITSTDNNRWKEQEKKNHKTLPYENNVAVKHWSNVSCHISSNPSIILVRYSAFCA